MDTLISSSAQTALEEPVHRQPSNDPKPSIFADNAPTNDSPGSAPTQSSLDSNVRPPEALLKSTQQRELPIVDMLDNSPSEKQEPNEENGPSEGKNEASAKLGDQVKAVSK